MFGHSPQIYKQYYINNVYTYKDWIYVGNEEDRTIGSRIQDRG